MSWMDAFKTTFWTVVTLGYGRTSPPDEERPPNTPVSDGLPRTQPNEEAFQRNDHDDRSGYKQKEPLRIEVTRSSAENWASSDGSIFQQIHRNNIPRDITKICIEKNLEARNQWVEVGQGHVFECTYPADRTHSSRSQSYQPTTQSSLTRPLSHTDLVNQPFIPHNVYKSISVESSSGAFSKAIQNSIASSDSESDMDILKSAQTPDSKADLEEDDGRETTAPQMATDSSDHTVGEMIDQLDCETSVEGFFKRPNGVYDAIGSVLEILEVKDHQIRHDPSDLKRIIIYVSKVKLEEAELKFRELDAEVCCTAYNLVTMSFEDSGYSTHTLSIQLNGDGTENGHVLPFRLMKSVSTTSTLYPGRHVATAGLVLQGFQPSRCTKSEFGSDFFAISTAHAALTEDECLLLQNSSEDFRRICQKVVGDLAFSTWFLTSPREGGIHISGIPIFSYRHFYHPVRQTEWYQKFLHDILLFRLCKEDVENKNWLKRDPETLNKWLQVHTTSFGGSPHPRFERKRILGILQVKDKSDIDLLESRRVKIVVATTTGSIVPAPHQQILHTDMPRVGLHICFKADSPLIHGQSGSIIYVVKRRTKELLILGMLTGIQKRNDADSSTPIYQGTLMWPALAQVQAQNPHKVSDLAMVDCDTREDTKEALTSLQPSDSGFSSLRS